MTTTPAPEPPEAERDDVAESALARARRALTWQMLFRLMISPMAFLAPCVSCGAAITLGQAFGPIGGFLGAVGGFFVGLGCIFLWYFVIVAESSEQREEAFAARLEEDVKTGRLGRRLDRDVQPHPEAIPLTAAHALAIDISGDVGEAAARIDIHEDPSEALEAAEVLRKANARDARAVATAARALLRAGRPKEALVMAGEALHVAVLTDQIGEVSKIVQTFWELREGLALDPTIAGAVADHLERKGQLDRAEYFRSGRTSLI
jgi:hypothetical protein